MRKPPISQILRPQSRPNSAMDYGRHVFKKMVVVSIVIFVCYRDLQNNNLGEKMKVFSRLPTLIKVVSLYLVAIISVFFIPGRVSVSMETIKRK